MTPLLRRSLACLSLVVALSGTLRADPPATQPSARMLPSDSVSAAEVGIVRVSSLVTIPAGHKLLVLYRVYHHQKLDAAKSLCLTHNPAGGRGGTYPMGISLLDPDELNPQPTDKLKLTLAGIPRWLTAKDKHQKLMTGTVPADALKVGHTYKFADLAIGGELAKTVDGVHTPEVPPEWRVTLLARIEPQTDEEAKNPHPRTDAASGDAFPFKEGHD